MENKKRHICDKHWLSPLYEPNNPFYGPLSIVLSFFRHARRLNIFGLVSHAFNNWCYNFLDNARAVFHPSRLRRLSDTTACHLLKNGIIKITPDVISSMAECGNLLAIKILCKSMLPVTKSKFNSIVMSVACMYGKIEIAKFILSYSDTDKILPNPFQQSFKRASLLLKDNYVYQNAAISIASIHGHLEIVKLLLNDKRVDPSYNNNYAIGTASVNGHLEVVKLLLKDKRVDPSDNNNYAIKSASEKGYLEIVKLLLKDKRVDPSDDGNYAIKSASESGYLEIVKLLLKDNRVDPSIEDNYAIKSASEHGHLDVIKLLLLDERINVVDNFANIIKGGFGAYGGKGFDEIFKVYLDGKKKLQKYLKTF